MAIGKYEQLITIAQTQYPDKSVYYKLLVCQQVKIISKMDNHINIDGIKLIRVGI
jgi:hypothetical protein